MKMATLLSDWFHLDKIVLLSSFVYMIETTQAVHFSNMKLVDPNQIVSWVRKKKKITKVKFQFKYKSEKYKTRRVSVTCLKGKKYVLQ